MALLVKHEWKLAYVTPLYQFRHTRLKLYSKHLTSFIVAEKQQGLAVEVGMEAGLKVTISTVLGMAESEDDAETVFIQVNVLVASGQGILQVLCNVTGGVFLCYQLQGREACLTNAPPY